MNLNEARLGLLVAIATLMVNIWMAIQNRKPRQGKRGRHRKR